MFSGVNKRCNSCQKECKQYKQITIIVCPNYEPKKVLNTQKVYLDSIEKSPELACRGLEMVQGKQGYIPGH